MKNIGDINAFVQFTQLCAGRVGQLLNYTGLANDAGISPNTAKAWLSIQVNLHYMKGALFENLIINEFIKHNFNRGEVRPPYFWQDSRGKEIDCLLVDDEKIVPIEIKSCKTISNSYFDNIEYWRQLTTAPKEQGYVVFGGNQSLQTSTGSFVSWRELKRIAQ